jgi:hypothetical protein
LLLLTNEPGQPLSILVQLDRRVLFYVRDDSPLAHLLLLDLDRWLRVVVRRPRPFRSVRPDPHQPLDPHHPELPPRHLEFVAAAGVEVVRRRGVYRPLFLVQVQVSLITSPRSSRILTASAALAASVVSRY